MQATEVNSKQELTLNFNQDIPWPDDVNDWDYENRGGAFIILTYSPSDSTLDRLETAAKLQDLEWKILSVSPTKLTIKMDWVHENLVSVDRDFDRLKIDLLPSFSSFNVEIEN